MKSIYLVFPVPNLLGWFHISAEKFLSPLEWTFAVGPRLKCGRLKTKHQGADIVLGWGATTLLLFLHLGVDSAPIAAAPLPTKIDRCSNTTVKWVGTRLEDEKNRPLLDSGSAVAFANDGYQVSYDRIKAIEQSRRGDKVRLCLQSIPHPCPPGDNRGRVYKTFNFRTGKSWTLPDSQHVCGGA